MSGSEPSPVPAAHWPVLAWEGFAPPERVLIRATNWVGDAILSTPVYRTIKKNYPKAHVAVLARPAVAGVLEGHPDIDDLIVDDSRGLFAMRRLGLRLSTQNYDLGIALPNSLSSAMLLWMADVPRRIGFATQGRSWFLTNPLAVPAWLLSAHQINYYLWLLKDWCRDFTGVRAPTVTLEQKHRDEADGWLREAFGELPERLIAVAPGAAYGTAKRWPPSRYAAIIRRLALDRDASVVLIGGKAEKPLADEVADEATRHREEVGKRVANACGTMSLRSTGAMLTRCRHFLTNDSGAMHLAAALNVPTTVMVGPTDWRTTPPWSDDYTIVRDPTDCAPCLLRHCPIDHRCMAKLGVDDVWRSLAPHLA